MQYAIRNTTARSREHGVGGRKLTLLCALASVLAGCIVEAEPASEDALSAAEDVSEAALSAGGAGTGTGSGSGGGSSCRVCSCTSGIAIPGRASDGTVVIGATTSTRTEYGTDCARFNEPAIRPGGPPLVSCSDVGPAEPELCDLPTGESVYCVLRLTCTTTAPEKAPVTQTSYPNGTSPFELSGPKPCSAHDFTVSYDARVVQPGTGSGSGSGPSIETVAHTSCTANYQPYG